MYRAARLREHPSEGVRLAARVMFRRMIRTQPHSGGWLEVVCGPMFCGKSEELIRRLRRAEIAGQRALIVKPLIDDRYDVGHVVSHAGAKMRAVTATSGDEVRRLAQRLRRDRHRRGAVLRRRRSSTRSTRWSQDGARVVAAGLAQDFRGLPFGAMPTLLCVAEFVDKLEAVCHRCGGPATMTQRLVDGAPAPFGGETIQVGALDSYEARCRACFQPGVDAARIAQTA